MLHMQGNPICIWYTRIKHLEHAAGAVDAAVQLRGKAHQNQNHPDQQSRLNLISQGGGSKDEKFNYRHNGCIWYRDGHDCSIDGKHHKGWTIHRGDFRLHPGRFIHHPQTK